MSTHRKTLACDHEPVATKTLRGVIDVDFDADHGCSYVFIDARIYSHV
ncbi:MAG TPA: hypothetical protein PKA76_18160 [Pirellulaceae bacterium]|nr:hypothetical protein [Pirellulaceae bacterium]